MLHELGAKRCGFGIAAMHLAILACDPVAVQSWAFTRLARTTVPEKPTANHSRRGLQRESSNQRRPFTGAFDNILPGIPGDNEPTVSRQIHGPKT